VVSSATPSVKGILLVQTADAGGARLRAALSERPELEVIDEVSDTHAAVESSERLQPGVVVMDVGLKDVAGNGVLRSLRRVAPAARIVLHARAADVEAPGGERWIGRLVDVVLDPEHGAVLEARLELPDEPRSVTMSRAFLAELLGQWELEEFVAAAALLMSELVANAVRHVPGPCALELTHHADVLRVAVADTGAGMPDLQVLGTSDLGGRGLHIVTSLSTAWGVDQLDDGGKLVWAELDPVKIGVP
jgi:anti-sigma regulatory factor (Ser/Thr protein kinase)/CheY-like chemotaxis protein